MARRTPTPASGEAATPPNPAPVVSPADAGTPPAAEASPPSAPEPSDAPADADTGELVEARALVSFADNVVNDVVTGSADEIAALVADGLVDDDPEAVAYAYSLLDA